MKASVVPRSAGRALLSVVPAQAGTQCLLVIPRSAGRALLSVVPAQAGTQCLLWLLLATTPTHAETDPQTGLKIAPGYEQVKAQCTACHSARLVAQNRADRDGWRQMIRWMQDTQNLWPLGDAEEPILDYLAANYGPLPRGRRAPLDATFD